MFNITLNHLGGYSGTKAGIEVNLNHLSTLNHDPHVVGEDGSSIAQSKEWKEARKGLEGLENSAQTLFP